MAFHDTRIHRGRAQISPSRNTHWPHEHGIRVPSLSASFYWLAGAIARARQRRKTYRILSALSDRTLDDIGLTRADVGDLAHGSAATAATRLEIAAHRRS